jgi:C-terminal processing protease CtpA/Prc
VIAGALAARAATATFGAPTRGLSTGNRTFPLADGAALVLTVAQTSDRHGRVYNGPLVPDVLVEHDGRDTALDEQPAVEAARQWLLTQPACTDGRVSHR